MRWLRLSLYFIGVDFECRSQRNLEGVSNLTENALGTPPVELKGGLWKRRPALLPAWPRLTAEDE